MKRLLIITSLPFLISCGATSVNSTKTNSTQPDSVKVTKEINPTSAWEYNDEEDRITSKKIYYATLPATGPLDLKFPYEGSKAELVIRKQDGSLNAIISVTKGQFMANVIDQQDIKVRFDSLKAEVYTCSASSDGDSKLLFINSPKKFVDKLKKSKAVVIEAEMYENGFQQMEFNSQGLIWNH